MNEKEEVEIFKALDELCSKIRKATEETAVQVKAILAENEISMLNRWWEGSRLN